MKKLSLLLMLVFMSICLITPQLAHANLSAPAAELNLSPSSKGLSKKEQRKRIRNLRKQYKKELRGMNKGEKQAFLADKLANPSHSQNIPHKKLLIIALIFLLVSVVLGLILNSYIFYFIGVVLLVVWLILFLLDYA